MRNATVQANNVRPLYAARAKSQEVQREAERTGAKIVPEDWALVRLSELGQFLSGGTPPTSDVRFWGGDLPWVSSKDMKVTRLSDAADHVTKLAVGSGTRLVEPGTLLIVVRGMSLAHSLPVAIADRPLTFNQDLKAFVPNSHVHGEFILRWLEGNQSRLLQLATEATHGTKRIPTEGLLQTEIPLPPHAEQCAIAKALSDVDGLLGALETLIAKRRVIKRTAMQRLFTGQTRLPGFSEEWTELNMVRDSVLKARIGWQGLTTAEYLVDGEYYLVTGTDFVNGRVNWSSCHFVDGARFVQDRNIQLAPGDVLLTKDGTIGKAGYVDSLPGPATLNSGVFVVRPKNDAYVPLYMYYVLTSHIFGEFLTRLQAGSTISHLYQRDFVRFAFRAPALDEQAAVAAVLSDMDAEIAALETRRDKTRAIKRGILQHLLNGRVRLIEPSPGRIEV